MAWPISCKYSPFYKKKWQIDCYVDLFIIAIILWFNIYISLFYTHRHPLMSKLRICSPPTIPSCELHLNVNILICVFELVCMLKRCMWLRIVTNSPVAVLKSNIIEITVRFLPEFNAGVFFPFSHGRFDNVLVFCSYVEKINIIIYLIRDYV